MGFWRWFREPVRGGRDLRMGSSCVSHGSNLSLGLCGLISFTWRTLGPTHCGVGVGGLHGKPLRRCGQWLRWICAAAYRHTESTQIFSFGLRLVCFLCVGLHSALETCACSNCARETLLPCVQRAQRIATEVSRHESCDGAQHSDARRDRAALLGDD